MSAYELLSQARDLLDGGRRWVRGTYADSAGPDGQKRYCALGAVNQVTFGSATMSFVASGAIARGENTYVDYQGERHEIDLDKVKDRQKAVVILAKAMGRNPVSPEISESAAGEIIDFNDLGNRNASEVLAAFDRAVEAAGEGVVS